LRLLTSFHVASRVLAFSSSVFFFYLLPACSDLSPWMIAQHCYFHQANGIDIVCSPRRGHYDRPSSFFGDGAGFSTFLPPFFHFFLPNSHGRLTPCCCRRRQVTDFPPTGSFLYTPPTLPFKRGSPIPSCSRQGSFLEFS